ncbi:MAG TPA: SHOCT domain-containing protein [Propionibacteriaceae bacterium]
MGLIRGMARTAVVAGTATAVSNRVSRRQGNRWAEKDQQQADAEADEQQQAAPPQQAYAPPPPPPQPQAPAESDMLSQLQQLGELKAAGVLTEEEFAAQKAKILGS